MALSCPTARLSCSVASIFCIMLCTLLSHLTPKCFISPSVWRETGCGLQPAKWMTMWSGTIGLSAHHFRWKHRSFFCTATSRPKVRQNADTMFALACRASCVPANDTRSFAAAVSFAWDADASGSRSGPRPPCPARTGAGQRKQPTCPSSRRFPAPCQRREYPCFLRPSYLPVCQAWGVRTTATQSIVHHRYPQTDVGPDLSLDRYPVKRLGDVTRREEDV